MDALMQKVQNEFGYSDREISLIRYSLTAICYDFSKILIFSIFFYCTGKFIHFLFAVVPLILLRSKTGGIHFKTYLRCLFFSFAYLYSAINILPALIPLQPWAIYLILLLCAATDYIVGPNSLNRKAKKDGAYTKKAYHQTLLLIGFLTILIFLFSANEFLLASFWTIVLHSIQLTITPSLKEVKYHEELD